MMVVDCGTLSARQSTGVAVNVKAQVPSVQSLGEACKILRSPLLQFLVGVGTRQVLALYG